MLSECTMGFINFFIIMLIILGVGLIIYLLIFLFYKLKEYIKEKTSTTDDDKLEKFTRDIKHE